MGTASLTELRLLVRNPQLVITLVVLPLLFIGLLSEAGAPVWPTSNPYQSTVPAYTVMFAFYGGAFAAEAFFRERMWSNWPRLLSLPVSRWSISAGKLLATTSVVLVIQLLLFGFGVVVLDIRLGNVIGLVVVLAATSVAATSLGPFLAGVGDSQLTIDQVSNVMVLGMAGLGGAIVPSERLPEVLQPLVPLTPQYWALQGITKATEGSSLVELLPVVAALCAFTLVAYGAAAFTFRWSRMTESV